MNRGTIDGLMNRRLAAMSDEGRVEFDQAYEASRLAIDVGEKVFDVREAAGPEPA